MILPGNASLILSITQNLIKLGGRIDNLLAEKAAVQSSVVLGMPAVRIDDIVKQKKLVADALAAHAGVKPDPFGSDRAVLEAELVKSPVGPDFFRLLAKYCPDATAAQLIDPDAAYLAKLRSACPGPDWKDPAVRLTAFALAAGTDQRELSYSSRIALSVADTFLEFGAENTALFVKDKNLETALKSVLQRFAEPEWGEFENWHPLLQAALRATLNAALDVGEKLPPNNPWLNGVLDALVDARKDATNPDDFVLGLVRGEGFPSLLAHGLLNASNRLADDQANAFKQVAADVLKKGADLIKAGGRPGFRTFFNDHWGDLLRAGLTSVEAHGDQLLTGANPLLRDVLNAVTHQLSQTADSDFLTSDTLFHLTDAAIAVVAANPGEIPGLENKPWLRDFIAAAAGSAKQLTARKLFTGEAAEALLLDAVDVLAKNPELIIKQPGLPLTLVTDVLKAVAQLKRLDARQIGEAALRATLSAISSDPSLAGSKFGPAIVTVTGKLAALVGTGKITGAQATEIAVAAIDATARNPKIFADLQKGVADAVIAAVQKTVPDTAAAPWAGRMLVTLASNTLLAVARTGGPAATNKPAAEFEKLLTDILGAGLQLAQTELGTSLDLEGVPSVVAGLVERALRGDLQNLNPAAPDFVVAFKTLAAVAARA